MTDLMTFGTDVIDVPDQESPILRVEIKTGNVLEPGGNCVAFIRTWKRDTSDYQTTASEITIYDPKFGTYALETEFVNVQFNPDSDRFEVIGSTGLLRMAKADGAIAPGGSGVVSVWFDDPAVDSGENVTAFWDWADDATATSKALDDEVFIAYIRSTGKWRIIDTNVPGASGPDVFFKIDATDDQTGYWREKVIAFNGEQVFNSAADLPITYEIQDGDPGAGTDLDATLFVDISNVASYSDSAFEVLGIDASNVTRMFSPKTTNTIDAAQDFELAWDVASVTGEINPHLDASSITGYQPLGNDLLGHTGTTKRWLHFADECTWDTGEDIPVCVDFGTTPGEMQVVIDADSLTNYSETNVQSLSHRATGLPIWLDYVDEDAVDSVEDVRIKFDFVTTTDGLIAFWDLSAVNDYSQSKMQFFGHFGSGAPNWFEFETSPGATDPTPEVPRDVTEDILMSWEIDPSDFKIQIFLDADRLGPHTAHTPAHPENLAHNSSGEPVWRNYADYQASETYNAGNHIPVWMTEEDGTGGVGSKSQARLYLDPDGVPGTDPASGERTAIAINFPSNAFTQALIDPAYGAIRHATSQTVTTGGGDVDFDTDDESEHTTNNLGTDTIELNRDGLWLLVLQGEADAGGTGDAINAHLTIGFEDETFAQTLNAITITLISIGSVAVRQSFCLTDTIDIASSTAIGATASTTVGNCTLYNCRLQAFWIGKP